MIVVSDRQASFSSRQIDIAVLSPPPSESSFTLLARMGVMDVEETLSAFLHQPKKIWFLLHIRPH